jgi:hypothetical protein
MAARHDERPRGDLFVELSRDIDVLLPKELELATTEITTKAQSTFSRLRHSRRRRGPNTPARPGRRRVRLRCSSGQNCRPDAVAVGRCTGLLRLTACSAASTF